MNTADFSKSLASTRQIWAVGALCLAVSDALSARFNPVAVQGEVSGFTRASSGHCYFTLKDAGGQLRCAFFKRAAQTLTRELKDGDEIVDVVFNSVGIKRLAASLANLTVLK